MRYLLIALSIVFLSTIYRVEAVQTQEKPILVLMQSDTVTARVETTFALYESGQVIYKTPNGYFSTIINLDQFLARFDLDIFLTLEDSYVVPDASYIVPVHAISLWHKEVQKTVTIYGDLTLPPARAGIPPTLLTFFDELSTYENSDALTWLPEFIEVTIWPAASQQAMLWPTAWPRFDDTRTIDLGNDQYKVFLPSSLLAEVQGLDDQTNAVIINEQVWRFAWRVPLPADSQWLGTTPLSPKDAEFKILQWGNSTFQTWTLTPIDNEFGYNIAIIWSRQDPSSVAFFSQDIQVKPYTIDELDTLINDDWLAGTMVNYESWEFESRCVKNNHIIAHMTAFNNEIHYNVRYWAWWENGNFNRFTLIIDEANATELETIATTLFGEAASCSEV